MDRSKFNVMHGIKAAEPFMMSSLAMDLNDNPSAQYQDFLGKALVVNIFIKHKITAQVVITQQA